MKKIFALLLVVAMLFCMVGCVDGGSTSSLVSGSQGTGEGGQGTGEGGQGTGTSSETEGEGGFVEPTGYAAIIEVTLKEKMTVYLSQDNNVMAIDYGTEEMKNMYSPLKDNIVGKKGDEAIKNLIDITNDFSPAYFGGIEKVVVNVKAGLDTFDKNAFLSAVVTAVNALFAEKGITKTFVAQIGGDTIHQGSMGNTASDPFQRPNVNVNSPEDPRKNLEYGVKYVLITESRTNEPSEILVYTITFDQKTKTGSYFENPYSYEYGDPNVTLVYRGKTYMQAGGAGGAFTFEYSEKEKLYILSEMGGGTDTMRLGATPHGSLTIVEYNGLFGEMATIRAGEEFEKGSKYNLQ